MDLNLTAITVSVSDWVRALRSGDVKQGRMHLMQDCDDHKEQSYCCLGLACEISDMGSWDSAASDNAVYVYQVSVATNTKTHDTTDTLPEQVRRALGLRTNIGDFMVTRQWMTTLRAMSPRTADRVVAYLGFEPSVDSVASTSLAALNDNGLTFNDIANIIDSDPPQLFCD